MKTSRALTFGGFTALVSTSIFGSTTGAFAANVDGCGLEPAGGTLENLSGTCELTFDTAGDYSWTLPAGIAGLHAMLVGAGGGAGFEAPDWGYAGGGGSIEYVDLTSNVSGDTVSGQIGEGGTTARPDVTAGEYTTLSVNGGSNYIASGGSAGSDFAWSYCSPGFRDSWYWGENTGAGVAGDPANGAACVGGGPGLAPSDDPDAPAIFDDVTTEFGHGGGALLNTSRALLPGDGANVFLDSVNDDVTADPKGADGLVVFRYTASDANNVGGSGGDGSTGSLASTGNSTPVAALALASIAAIAAGLGASAFGRRRSASNR